MVTGANRERGAWVGASPGPVTPDAPDAHRFPVPDLLPAPGPAGSPVIHGLPGSISGLCACAYLGIQVGLAQSDPVSTLDGFLPALIGKQPTNTEWSYQIVEREGINSGDSSVKLLERFLAFWACY